MKDNVLLMKKCPLCGKPYAGASAISRTDSKTPICPDCGTRQALEALGIGRDEQEEILDIIHAAGRR